MPKRISSQSVRRFIYFYIGGLLALCLLILASLPFFVEAKDILAIFWDSLGLIFVRPLSYFLAAIPYGIYLLVKNLRKDFRLGGQKGLLKGILLKILLPICFFYFLIKGVDVYRLGENFTYEWDHEIEYVGAKIQDLFREDGKQRGIHVFGLSNDTLDLEILKKNRLEWITFVPFISQRDYQEPFQGSNFERRDSLKRYERLRKNVAASRRHGFHIMLKPHIWLSDPPAGVWRSKIEMKSEADWELWFDRYTGKMLEYAAIAEELEIEIFCVGVELHTTVIKQPERWKKLIEDIKKVYKGKLTYAANWSDDLEKIPFWDQMDFVGVQAYFPIAQNRNPELEELEEGWKVHAEVLKKVSRKLDKPILFTEIGYKSTSNAGIEPWEWNSAGNRFYRRISHKTQALCYQAFFNVIWKEPWFAGVYIWEWQSRGTDDGFNNSFTLEGKPALNIVAKGFAP